MHHKFGFVTYHFIRLIRINNYVECAYSIYYQIIVIDPFSFLTFAYLNELINSKT